MLILSSCGGSSGSSGGPDPSQPNPSPTNQAPTIDLIGDSAIALPFGGLYSELGATALDAEDGDLSGEIQISGDMVNSSVAGDYVISYQVTDSGHLSTSTERTVTVLVNQPPSISLLGENPTTLAYGSVYSEAGATASDPEEGDLTSQVQISGEVVNSSAPGNYLISYEVADSGNLSASTERTVTVLVNQPPSISLLGESLITLAYGANYIEAGATASDPEEGDLTSQIQISGDTVNPLVAAEYTISYGITDAGGLSVSLERAVTVLPNESPVITLNGLMTIYLDQDETYADQGATALDEEDGDLTSAILVESNLDTNNPGTYQVTYRVTDSAGASDQVERSVVVSATEPDYCVDIDLNARGIYDDIIQRWVDQDDATPRRDDSIVFAGSSSIRYWESLYESFSALNPIQRGFGGARIWDVAQRSDDLISRHSPSAVVVFASNSIPQGLTVEQTVDGYQCLIQRLDNTVGDIPIVYIGMTPVPARWDIWPEHDEANQAIQALADGQPHLYYVDAPTEFLKTGSPPSLSLFQDDEIHLTEDGYQIWLDLLTPLLGSIFPSPNPPPLSTLSPTGRILIDLGPSNAEDGTLTNSPDGFGQAWNNLALSEGGDALYAGESLGELIDTSGNLTNVRLLVTGEMRSNGLLNGGLRNPDSALLGNFAVDTATQDYIYANESALGDGSLSFIGLDNDATYRLRLFGSRDATDTRFTRYVVTGASSAQQIDLQTSGNGIGESGNGNDRNIAEFNGVQPDSAGAVHIDFSTETGNISYLSIIELITE